MLLTWTSSLAYAQEASAAPEAVAEARSLFELGTRAVHEGRFREADEALSRSLVLVPRPATAFNLVVALRGLGAMVRATGVCERQLLVAALDPAQATEARTLCDEVRGAVGHLTVRAVGSTPFVLRIDGAIQGELAPGDERTLSLDPGDHHLLALADGLSGEHDVRLPPGGSITLALSAPLPASVDVGLVVGVTVGSAAAVVLAVVIGVVVASSASGPVYDYPVTMTLTRF
jgi:hypothetical protein